MSQPDGRVTILPPIALSPKAAREFTYDVLAGWRLTSSVRDEVVLVVDEIVTHAVKHGRGPIMVVLTLTGDTIHVEVTEESDVDLPEQPASVGRPGETEFAVIGALSRQWGTRRRAQGGGTVWAEVATDRDVPRQDARASG